MLSNMHILNVFTFKLAFYRMGAYQGEVTGSRTEGPRPSELKQLRQCGSCAVGRKFSQLRSVSPGNINKLIKRFMECSFAKKNYLKCP